MEYIAEENNTNPNHKLKKCNPSPKGWFPRSFYSQNTYDLSHNTFKFLRAPSISPPKKKKKKKKKKKEKWKKKI